MKSFNFSSSFFNVADTLECGQTFRFTPYKQGYLVFSQNKCCFAYTEGDLTTITCEDADYNYFYNYFDLAQDYSKIYQSALSYNVQVLRDSAEVGKGIRILNQNLFEVAISFIISQNNNIPRIKSIIEKLCTQLGEQKLFMDTYYYTFPTIESFLTKPLSFFEQVGLGYRAKYIYNFIQSLASGLNLLAFCNLSTPQLKKQLISIYGIGPKVADCITLFGYHRGDSFPVDTWIYKLYVEDFNGSLTSREKVAQYFVSKFENNAGYFQQYLFYYKRLKEKSI